MRYKEIRCPSDRPHTSKKDDGFVEFDLCGALIGAVCDEDSDDNFIVHCPRCKSFWNISVNFYGDITMSKVDGRIDLVDDTKVIE